VTEDGDVFEDSTHVYYSVFEQSNKTRFQWLNYFFYNGNALCHPSVLIRKNCYEITGLYRYGLWLLVDLDMWVRLCLKCEIYVLPDKLIRFRLRTGGQNTSTYAPGIRSRRSFEFLQILDNYKALTDPEDFLKVFPKAEHYIKAGGFDLGFALGMIAIESCSDKFSKLMGLNLLFDALNDPARASIIDHLYGFNNKDLVSLIAQEDVFSVELIDSLKNQMRHDEHLMQQLKQKQGELSGIYNSKSWRLIMLFQKIRNFLWG
jgi:hypothetical protein